MKAYLIQRGTVEDRDYKTGLDSIVSLDYMGSSEFEWGALPNSLKRIRDNLSEYTYMDVPIYNKAVSVFCQNQHKSDIKGYLKTLATDKMFLKERSCFDDCVNPSEREIEWQKKFPLKINFWWDLDNDLMFWIKNPEFETKFKVLIEKKPKP